jgi:hypothetical protein
VEFGKLVMMAKPRVYIETSVVSYLTSRPSRDVVVVGHQQITRDWWQMRRGNFHLVASQLVVQEAGAGNETAAQARLEVLDEVELIEAKEAASKLSRELVERGPLPQSAVGDALHIAIAVTTGVDYLLTWNCRHLANAKMRTAIERVCRSNGYEPCIICTPEELMEE